MICQNDSSILIILIDYNTFLCVLEKFTGHCSEYGDTFFSLKIVDFSKENLRIIFGNFGHNDVGHFHGTS